MTTATPAEDDLTDDEVAVEAATAEAPEEAAQQAAMQHLAGLLQTGDSGANWFFWIAGLSLVNSAIIHFGGNVQFVVGLGVTLFVDAIATEIIRDQPQTQMIATSVAVGFSVFCSLIACLFGWLSRKRIIPLFALGMAIYFLDGLVFLLVQDWLSLAFHGYALFCMWSGLTAYRQFNQIESELAVAAEPA